MKEAVGKEYGRQGGGRQGPGREWNVSGKQVVKSGIENLRE